MNMIEWFKKLLRRQEFKLTRRTAKVGLDQIIRKTRQLWCYLYKPEISIILIKVLKEHILKVLALMNKQDQQRAIADHDNQTQTVYNGNVRIHKILFGKILTKDQ